MKLTNATLGMALAGIFAIAVPVIAQTVELTPEEAAGKVIFEETAGGIGCAACHGMDGQGGITDAPANVGAKAELVQSQIDNSSTMSFIELTPEEVQQVTAYLQVLNR